jgi:hypothetical protein
MKTIIRALCILLLLLMAVPSVGNTALNVWLIPTQSNGMSGSPGDIPEWCNSIPPNVEYWVESDYPNFSWITQYNTTFNAQQNFGPEVLLAFRLAEYYPDEEHLIIRFSRGGTNLAQQWCKDCELYDRLLEIISWVVGPREVVYRGLIWIQGEGDTVDVNKAVAYKSNLTEMIGGIRDSLNAPNMPVLIIPTDVPEIPYTYIFNVAQGQKDFCQEDLHCRTVTNSGLARYADNVHYTSSSQLAIGARAFWVWCVHFSGD